MCMAGRCVLLLCCCVSASRAQHTGDPAPATAAIGSIREAQTSSHVVLPELGLEFVDARRVQPDGHILRDTTRTDGTPADLDALRLRDHALGLQRRGGLSPHLAGLVATLAPGAHVDVAFWLRSAAADPAFGADLRRRTTEHARRLSGDELAHAVRAERARAVTEAAERLRPDLDSFAARVVGLGGEVLGDASAWPVVFARLDSSRLRALAADPAVDVAYTCQPTWVPEGEIAQGTLRTPTVWAQGVTLTSQVNILVNDTSHVQAGHPFLPPIIKLNVAPEGLHATGVAGNIACTHPDHLASCHDAQQIFSAAGFGDSSAPPTWAAAISLGIDFGNCSWWNLQKGSIEFLDRFFDYTIRNYGVMMFKSTGNQGDTLAPYSTTPGNGFNMISSGAYSDADDMAWDGDSMASSSSYWNPVQGHEKPELVSPGTCVTTTGSGASGLQTCFGGTSSASPLTCGVAALVTAGDSRLLSQMTTVKAVLMASAWHNLEGDPLLSEHDGAGGVHAAAAWAVVRDEHWVHAEVQASEFVGGVLDVPFPIPAREDVRVAAVWFGNPDSAVSSDLLEMDLDLAILDPAGVVVASSASAFNPFELAGFRAAESGTYTARLTRQRFDGASEPLTLAWSTRSDTAVAEVGLIPGSQSFDIGNSCTLRFRDAYDGAGRAFVAWCALGGAPGIALDGSGFSLPAGLDYMARFSVALPGFVGSLDAQGEATAPFVVPAVTSAIGLTLHFGLVVFGPSGAPDDVQTVGSPAALVIGP